ncbi:MAG TPA: antitoxin family protein [Pseudonocardiaceae bacterium]
MDFHGVFENGVVRPTESVALPDGTEVECHAVAQTDRSGVAELSREFFANLSIEELARQQGVGAVQTLEALAGDWPDEDSLDEFLAFLRRVRV